MEKHVCARPIHPGEILTEEIEYRVVSKITLAEQMGVSDKTLDDILNERQPVTIQIAMLFEAALGVDANILINMQKDYDIQVTKRDKTFTARLAEVRKKVAAEAL